MDVVNGNSSSHKRQCGSSVNLLQWNKKKRDFVSEGMCFTGKKFGRPRAACVSHRTRSHSESQADSSRESEKQGGSR